MINESSTDTRVFDFDAVVSSLEAILAEADKYGAKVVSATKTVPAEIINLAFDNGLKYMGENRVNELLDKLDTVKFDKEHIHFIGTLQTNKVGKIIDKVALIHSLDSLHLAKEIDRQGKKTGVVMPCLVEINSGMEESKGGIFPDGVREFISSCGEFENVKIAGLMSIGPKMETEREYIPYFEKVSGIFASLKADGYLDSNAELSMGMSDNYRLALEYGATIIRPGSAIFGKRIYKV